MLTRQKISARGYAREKDPGEEALPTLLLFSQVQNTSLGTAKITGYSWFSSAGCWKDGRMEVILTYKLGKRNTSGSLLDMSSRKVIPRYIRDEKLSPMRRLHKAWQRTRKRSASRRPVPSRYTSSLPSVLRSNALLLRRMFLSPQVLTVEPVFYAPLSKAHDSQSSYRSLQTSSTPSHWTVIQQCGLSGLRSTERVAWWEQSENCSPNLRSAISVHAGGRGPAREPLRWITTKVLSPRPEWRMLPTPTSKIQRWERRLEVRGLTFSGDGVVVLKCHNRNGVCSEQYSSGTSSVLKVNPDVLLLGVFS